MDRKTKRLFTHSYMRCFKMAQRYKAPFKFNVKGRCFSAWRNDIPKDVLLEYFNIFDEMERES